MCKIKSQFSFFILITCIFYLSFTCVLYSYQEPQISAEMSSRMLPLFEKNNGEYYNYAPCMIQTDANTRYIYYCSNKESSKIIDYICWRKCTFSNGIWSCGRENIAFGPSSSGWDTYHVCDPDVIHGKFTYNNHVYSWALTYLGVAQWDCNRNQIGIAFSDSIEGPWIKYDNNPVIHAPDTYSWGVGQDSMISLDKKGLVRIIYRYSDGVDDYCKYRDFDFSNVNSYYMGQEHDVTRNGLVDGISHTCASHVAFDETRQVYFMAAEHIWDESKRSCRETLIATLSKKDFENSTGKWNVIYKYNQGCTGYISNHNSAIARDDYGKVFDRDRLVIALSSSDEAGLWSFKINTAELNITSGENSINLKNGHAYKITNKANNLVLDNWNHNNGTTCYQYEWTGVHNQQWCVTSLGINNYKLINRWSHKALDNYDNNTPNVVYIWDDVFAPDQHWEITTVYENYCKIKNIKTGKVLASSGNFNGSPTEATLYTGDDSQLWAFTDLGPVDISTKHITSGQKYKIVNCATEDVLDNWNPKNGETCYSYSWTASESQQWVVEKGKNNNYKILNDRTKKALDCYDTKNGSIVYVWDYVGNSDQHWTFVPISNGCFYIKNQKSGLVLTQSIQGNGNSIFCWNYVGGLAQQWKLIPIG